MAGGGGGGEGEPEFQIAPMIDVLLVLLIFFMSITTAQVLKVDRTIQIPIAPDGIKKDTARNEAVINVRWDAAHKKATYIMDENAYPSVEALGKALKVVKDAGEKKAARGGNPTFRVVIRGDREANAASVARAMNAAGEAGISDVSFSTVNKD